MKWGIIDRELWKSKVNLIAFFPRSCYFCLLANYIIPSICPRIEFLYTLHGTIYIVKYDQSEIVQLIAKKRCGLLNLYFPSLAVV